MVCKHICFDERKKGKSILERFIRERWSARPVFYCCCGIIRAFKLFPSFFVFPLLTSNFDGWIQICLSYIEFPISCCHSSCRGMHGYMGIINDDVLLCWGGRGERGGGGSEASINERMKSFMASKIHVVRPPNRFLLMLDSPSVASHKHSHLHGNLHLWFGNQAWICIYLHFYSHSHLEPRTTNAELFFSLIFGA